MDVPRTRPRRAIRRATEKDGEKSSEEKQDQGDSSSQAPKLPSLPLIGLDWLRTPLMIAGVLVLIYGVIRYGRDWLECPDRDHQVDPGGFGFGGKKERKKGDAGEEAEPAPPPRPFASYANPFDVGLDQQLTPDDLVIYSFETLEAWAYEHELARSPHETPSEFVSRIGQAHADLGPDATRMVGYFVMIVYGQRGFRSEVLPALRQFWRALEGSGGAVLAEQSAGV